MVAVRWSAAHLIHYQISESWRNHYIWDVCSASRWDVLKTATPAAGTGQQQGPKSLWQHLTTCNTTNTSKVEGIGLWSEVLPHLPRSPDFLPTTTSFKHLNNFQQGKRFYNQQVAENGFHEFTESRSMGFYATRLLICKNLLIVMVLFWLIKMCLSLVMI